MTQISRFTERCVLIAQRVTDDGDESAAPNGGGGFADYALVSLHCLRIYLDTSYRMTIDLLKEMPQVTREIGRVEANLPALSTFCRAFDRIEVTACRVLLRQSAQLHDPSEHSALGATFYERDRASRHYYHRTNYCVQTLKVTKLVDTETQAVLDLHCSATREGSDADLCEQIARTPAGDLRTLAADKGYNKNVLRKRLRELAVRSLTKHRITASYDHAHNARIDRDRYAQRSIAETINSAVKRSHGVSGLDKVWILTAPIGFMSGRR